jgi:NADH-quinone oxidoreductase subunit C
MAEETKGPAAAPLPPDPAPPTDLLPPPVIPTLQHALPDAVQQISWFVGDWTLVVLRDHLLDVMRWLRDDPSARFDFLSDVTATDWPSRPERFDVIYCLYSIPLHHRLRVKVRAGEQDPVPSVTPVWPAANWLEREVWDMFGVRFEGHPDLRRILMPDEWQGHPQRKDYPLEGPGELLIEDPVEWLKLRTERNTADIE